MKNTRRFIRQSVAAMLVVADTVLQAAVVVAWCLAMLLHDVLFVVWHWRSLLNALLAQPRNVQWWLLCVVLGTAVGWSLNSHA
ncbi:hypothetical protein [Burkholderia vietnamiensis]|uniref:hypothetical protein n=1 Tax=Burkholderia vietnamiensis TaxID=60552 RepID=UPI001D1504D5|nr:hypothetical protein [Burkholderia vietnamiensis]UEC05591.1 hypothetical protein LK462_34710 [Burkholderia vietnamiensis]